MKMRKTWRHFKYGILKLFFKPHELRRLIDLDRLDFEDSVRITKIAEERWMSEKEHELYFQDENLKYGIRYELARMMADRIAKHMDLACVFDTDEEKYLCVGVVHTIENK